MAADPPRKDGAELLLDKMFLGACKTVYSVFPEAQDSQEQHFMSKYFNVVDPLRTSNNLGRSVSKGNFFRIRSALSFGAQQLAKILECPEENLVAEVNKFFKNTWNRHGKGYRPDAPILDALHLKDAKDIENCRKNIIVEKSNENFVSQYPQPDKPHRSIDFPMHPGISSMNQISETIDVHKTLQSPRERDHVEESRTHWGQYYTQRKNPTKKQQNDKERISRVNLLPNRGHSRPQFARTSSSPELMSMPSKAGSFHKHNTAIERVKDISHSRSEYYRRSRGSDIENHAVNCVTDEPSQRLEGTQNVTNVVSSSGVQNYGGPVQMPMNLASYQYVPIPTFLPGFGPQKYAGKVPLNLAAFQSNWGDVMQYSNGPSGSQGGDHLDDEHGFWTDNNADSMREIDDKSGDFSTSFRTKASSESSWDGKTSKANNPVRYPVTKKSSSSLNPTEVVETPWLDDGGPDDHSYDDVNDNAGPTSVTSSHREVHHLSGFHQPHMGHPNSVLPFAPMFIHQGSYVYPTGPMPFVIPLYNVNAERGKSGVPPSNDHMQAENLYTTQNQPNIKPEPDPVTQIASSTAMHLHHINSNGSTKRTSVEHSDEVGLDIFSSDFPSHWKNLQYGRHCQNSQMQHPFMYSPAGFIPPPHSPGSIPFDSPRSPGPKNSNIFTNVVPVSAQLPGPAKPAGVSRQYDGEYTKHRNGTGTYFPNPKFLRDHQLSTSRQNQGDSRHDRNEQHWEREGDWNFSSKPRFSGRAPPRYRYDKSNSKGDRSVASGSHTDRHGDTFRKKSHQPHRFPRDASTSKPMWNAHFDPNHPVYQTHPRYYHNNGSQSENSSPPLVMFYPYPQTIAYGAPMEPMQFGSVAPQHFVRLEEVQELSGYPKGCDLEHRNYQGDSGPSSPDYASPPRFPRYDGD